MIKIKNILLRKEKRLLYKIQSPKIYKWILWIIFMIFWLKKQFLVFWKKWKKKMWLISITSNNFFWNKISYIDDFIISYKSRWRGIWKFIFHKIIKKAENEEKSDYIFLLTKKDRKKSHWIYKKFWFNLISLGLGYLAYKKIKNNNKFKK